MTSVTNFLFGFQGRIRRSQWWLAQLGSSALAGLIFVLLVYLFGGRAPDSVTTMLSGSLGIGGFAAFTWIQLAVGVKRLHDQGRSGWFYLLGFVPFIGNFILLGMLGFRDSEHGDNRSGASSKYPEANYTSVVFD